MPTDTLFLDYNPAHFAEAHREIGRDFEQFLTSRDNWIRFETATELRRPPAEVCGRRLLDQFGNRVRQLRYRQLFGHMLRHLMEKRGFVLEQEDVRIPGRQLFTRAARYKRKRSA